MRKLLALMMVSVGLCYADDCGSISSAKVAKKMLSKGKTSATFTYSADQKNQAEQCAAAVKEINKKLTINLEPATGTKTGILKFKKGSAS